MRNRLLVIIVILIISSPVLYYAYSLKKQRSEHIDDFYKKGFSGVISSIKQYEADPDKYVVGITDVAQNETSLGIVEITNFSRVMEGDSVSKNTQTFELITKHASEVIVSEVRF